MLFLSNRRSFKVDHPNLHKQKKRNVDLASGALQFHKLNSNKQILSNTFQMSHRSFT